MTTDTAVFGPTECQPVVFGVAFTASSLEEIAKAVTHGSQPHGSGAKLIVTMNLDHVVTLRRNAHFRSAYRSASIVTADGFPVYLYARWRGAKLAGRVTGSDLFPMIMAGLDPGKHRPFLVASNDVTLRHLERRLRETGFRPDQYTVVVPAFGFDRDAVQSEELLQRIEALKPTHIFMGVGAPKSEIWLDHHRARLGDAFVFGLGASLDFFVGTAQRAPKLVQSAGFEWLWRFASEPRRLFKRYFVDSWAFFAVVRDDLRYNGNPFKG